jgi:hypothetical protein
MMRFAYYCQIRGVVERAACVTTRVCRLCFRPDRFVYLRYSVLEIPLKYNSISLNEILSPHGNKEPPQDNDLD